jgi:hypothetical protein
MSITISQQNLLPIRRDKQIATGSISSSSGGGSSIGGGITYNGGTNICLGTGTTTTINVCGTVAYSNNSACLGGALAACYINCQANCLCVASATVAASAAYATCSCYASTAGAVTGALTGSQSGTYNNYLTKYCDHSALTNSLLQDNGTIVCLASGCFLAPKILENGTCLASTYLGISATAACATNANNSTCLNGQLSSSYAPIANPVFTGYAVYAPDFIATSSILCKKDITNIENALSTVMQLQGVNFKFCDDIREKCHIGLIAENTEKYLPEVINSGSTLGISYGNITALLIESIKEQQNQIRRLEKLVDNMRYLNNSK